DALQIVVRSLEAGHPVPTAISLVAREMPDPVGGEFRIAADEMSYGVSLSTAIERLALRSGDPDVELFAATVRLQERTGGNLCDLLEASIDTIRDRQTLRLKVNAASSEGRASAMILTAAPFVVAGAIYLMKPDFYGSVIDDPTFQKILAGLGVWLAIGNLIMRRMINFRF
ncbi:MAG: type II secretion system F family protein, partial [Pseudomonadota bacterium]